MLATDPMAMSVPQQAMMVSVLLPALNRAREQANRVKSASNLRQIGLGSFLMYQPMREPQRCAPARFGHDDEATGSQRPPGLLASPRRNEH